MKKILVSMLLAVVLFGCQAATITADAIGTSLSSAVITALDCQATAVVTSDIKVEVNRWFSIQAQAGRTETSIGGTLCRVAISSIVPTLLGASFDLIKPTWQCKLTKLDSASTVLADLVCPAL